MESPDDPNLAAGVPVSEEVIEAAKRTRARGGRLYLPKKEPGYSADLPSSLVAPLQPVTGGPLVPTNLSAQARIPLSVTKEGRQRIAATVARIEENLPQFNIESNLITIMTEEEILAEAVVAVTSPAETGYGSINDPRMGTIETTEMCPTCHRDTLGCTGHLGYIRLAEPILHPLFLRLTVSVLQSVCNSCGGLLLTENEIRAKGIFALSGERRLMTLAEESVGKKCRTKHFDKNGKETTCPENPRYIPKKLRETGLIMFQHGRAKKNAASPEMERTLGSIQVIFKQIKQKDAILMGFENGAHPIRFIMTMLPVIPPCDRIPLYQDGKRKPDQLTVMYSTIVKINNELSKLVPQQGIPLGANVNDLERKEKYFSLVNAISHFIDNTDGTYNEGKTKEYMSIKQRIQGKEGHIRGGMSGKRVNYTARTVISPDPTLRFGQVRVPRIFAAYLTCTVRVQQFNIDYLTDLLRKGQINNITQLGGEFTGQMIPVTEQMRSTLVLQIGDTVERWLQNGDYVIINRQPTLHRPSMMGAEVVLGDELTIGLHLSYTTPLNADFV